MSTNFLDGFKSIVASGAPLPGISIGVVRVLNDFCKRDQDLMTSALQDIFQVLQVELVKLVTARKNNTTFELACVVLECYFNCGGDFRKMERVMADTSAKCGLNPLLTEAIASSIERVNREARAEADRLKAARK